MLSAGYPAEVFASVCCLCCAVCRVCFSVLSHAVKPVLAPSQFEALSHTPYYIPHSPSHIPPWHILIFSQAANCD